MIPVDFVPGPEELGQRIDVVLAKRAGVTRTRAQLALRRAEVTVETRQVRPSHRLEQDERVSGNLEESELGPPEAEDIPIEVRYSDDRLLVVSKPAGLVTHPARGHDTGTLVNALLGLGVDLSGKGSVRPGIVHRLDKDTSGLLLVAKDDETHAFLLAAMQQRDIARHYFALVRGTLPARSGTIDAPVGRHPTRRRLMSVVATGRPAVTHYDVMADTDELSLLEVRLETGRTHQIRVHLSHLGHPILGDRVYGGVSELSRRLGLTRPFLHAARLSFPHPVDSHEVEVTDPLPEELVAALEAAGVPNPVDR